MFNNLIESTSHRKEFKRRGSFLLFTTITYAVLLSISGVVSIYAYDAHLEDQTYEAVITMMPVEPAPPATTKPAGPEKPRSISDSSDVAKREKPMVDVDRPDIVPDKIETKPNSHLPIPKGKWELGPDYNPPAASGGPKTPGTGGGGPPAAKVVLEEELPPQPPPQPPAKKIVVSKRVLNSEATLLPKPIYPPMARQIGLRGQVVIQVLIDEAGKVISAQVVSGHPILAPEAKKAALQARFTPTMIGDQPVKVSGVINYNFVMQ